MNANHILGALTGLAVVACFATLGAIGTITGDQALTGISTIVGFLFGAGGVAIGNALPGATPVPSAPPVVLSAPPTVPTGPIA